MTGETNTFPVYATCGNDDQFVGRFTLRGLDELVERAHRLDYADGDWQPVLNDVSWHMNPDLRVQIYYDDAK